MESFLVTKNPSFPWVDGPWRISKYWMVSFLTRTMNVWDGTIIIYWIMMILMAPYVLHGSFYWLQVLRLTSLQLYSFLHPVVSLNQLASIALHSHSLAWAY